MNNLTYLFDHPKEPLFVPRGEENITFNVPNEYLVSLVIVDSTIRTRCLKILSFIFI